MQRLIRKLVLLLSIIIAINVIVEALPFFQAFASSQTKKAKWQTPAKTTKPKKKPSKKKSVTAAKKAPAKKPLAPEKKSVLKKGVKKDTANASIKKDAPKKKPKVEKTPKENTLIVDQDAFEDEFHSEERSTSPLLVVFVTFVLCCVGGMLFLSNRKKQLEAARMNFQDTSNHDLAFSSSQELLDSRHPTHSGHETPTTRTLFERTERQDRLTLRSTGKETSIQFDNEDFNSGSITTIGAVRSKSTKTKSKPPVPINDEVMLDPMPGNSGPEPCSFEKYIEIQIATQCWRIQKLSIDTKLRETFKIDAAVLIQYEFYWKQKISNNVALKKKYQELEPLYTAKYEAAS